MPDRTMSRGGASPGKFAEARNFRAAWNATWAEFCVENFQSSAHLAHVFNVDERTARNWREGLNAPAGWAVAFALAAPETREAARQALVRA